MKVLVTGATGFVGKYILKELAYRGHDIVLVTRNIEKAKKTIGIPHIAFKWDPSAESIPAKALEGVDAVIHLLGENIAAGRWTKSLKNKIYNSRIKGTQNLVSGLNIEGSSVKTLVSSSAVGFYEINTDTDLIESSPKGGNWLSQVCHDWESEALKATHQRTVILRTGVVLGSGGGAMAKMILPFKMGAGGILGSGKQWMSWIHVKDLAALYVDAVEDKAYVGAYNATAPHSVSNHTFTKTLGKTISRPTLFPVPKFALKALFGEMSSILLDSQKVIPERLIKQGFNFSYANLPEALDDVCHKKKLAPSKIKQTHQTFEQFQWLPGERKEVFSFFGKPENLEKITPKWINFKIIKKSHEDVKEGATFDYKLKIKGLPIIWKTVIERFTPGEEFVDWQKSGPYDVWYHTHKFRDYKGGTLMEDQVFYRVPFGFLGELLLGAYIRRDIQKIFDHRRSAIEG
jgi:uncharacterized protein (TIGR01777 family)